MPLELQDISKVYRNGFKAVDQLSLSLGAGTFALLGPNGAGKSTLMAIAAGLLKPSSGSVRIDGMTPTEQLEAYRTSVGYLPQHFGFPAGSTPRSVLSHLARLRGLHDTQEIARRIDQVLEQLNLRDRIDARVASLSGGMRQRLGIAQALVHQPRVLILDEPTVGLDPDERERFLLLLSEYSRHAVVILSTHLIDDVEAVCQTIGFIAAGKLIGVGDRARVLSPLRDRVYSAPIGTCHPDGRLLYETVAGGRPVARFHAENPPADPAFERCTPSIRDAYALHLGAARQ